MLKCGLGVKKCVRCNLLEDDGEVVEWKGGEARVELKAFEVGTYRLQL